MGLYFFTNALFVAFHEISPATSLKDFLAFYKSHWKPTFDLRRPLHRLNYQTRLDIITPHYNCKSSWYTCESVS